MERNRDAGGNARRNRWRVAAWGAAAAALLLPWVAMQFTGEVAWGPMDFALGAVLVAAVGLAHEMVASKTRNFAYRTAAALALAAAFLLLWSSLAVGVIGPEDHPANAMVGAVVAVGIVGAALARLRAGGMAAAMAATALAQALIAVIAPLAGWSVVGPQLLVPTACFTAIWLMAAWLFWKAARQSP